MKTVINGHIVKRNLFGKVTINGQKTPLPYREAVKALQTESSGHWKSVWNRDQQRWEAAA